MACITIVRQFRLIDLWPCTCHTKPAALKKSPCLALGGGEGGWGYRVHSTVHMYSIICTINSIRGRGKGKLSYKLALAQLLQFLVLAITNYWYTFLNAASVLGICHFFSLRHHLVSPLISWKLHKHAGFNKKITDLKEFNLNICRWLLKVIFEVILFKSFKGTVSPDFSPFLAL